MKRPDGVTLIGVYHFLLGALALMGICAILIGLAAVLSSGERGAIWGGLALAFLAVVACVFAVASLAVGWGLLQMKEWARWGAIALAILSLTGFPIWTVIGGAIIWYLFRPEVKEAFGAA